MTVDMTCLMGIDKNPEKHRRSRAAIERPDPLEDWRQKGRPQIADGLSSFSIRSEKDDWRNRISSPDFAATLLGVACLLRVNRLVDPLGLPSTSNVTVYKKGVHTSEFVRPIKLATEERCHAPPRADRSPRLFSSIARAASVSAPDALMA
jgi:hypothetical protein